jgi:hypothetical protein
MLLRTGHVGTFTLLLVLAIPIGWVGRTMPNVVDHRWLPTMLVLGWATKLVASGARYWALEFLYNGVGDATGYHNFGTLYAPVWRSFHLPPLGTGTQFIQAATGFLYAPYTPTKLGGFFLFATLAFFGQLLLYAAFRHAFPKSRLKTYAALIFFFPNIVYWPSSIGKESLILPFISIAAYGAVRLFTDYRPKWVLAIAFGLLGSGLIRSHIALLLVLSISGAMFLGHRPRLPGVRTRRLLSMLGIAIVLVASVSFAIQDFGIDLSAGISSSLVEEELDPIFSGVENQTDRGGSAVSGTGIRSPLDVPEAVMRVVFQPLPWDANNAQTLASSIFEGSLLLGLFVLRGPRILRNLRKHWRDPYVTFSLIYCAGFIFGHSPVLNLGIVARQRSQMIPFVLVLLVALGTKPSRDAGTVAPEPALIPMLPRF